MSTDNQAGAGHALPRVWARSRDRRDGFPAFLAQIAHGLDRSGESQPLRRTFEEGLRRLARVRDVSLRESLTRLSLRSPHTNASAESICFEVETSDAARHAFLEATFEAGSGLDDWDFQVLGWASHVAALVLEIERNRGARPVSPGLRADRSAGTPLIGSSPGMLALRERIERVAATDFTVLVEGESGTGKELVARQIHNLSQRRHGPFVAINCAALVETLLEAELFGIEDRTATGVRGRRGKFEHADGGTLFLDEVSDLSLSAQAKLLRAIQDLAVERVGGQGTRRVNTRIVAATNRSLGGMVEKGLFRSDLFYRLSGVELRVPPLRQRREDTLELARHFLARHRDTRRLELSEAAADALLTYDWPGNVRELERLMESTVALAGSDRIEIDDLPPTLRGHYAEILMPSLARGDSMRAWGSRYARLILERCDHNKRKTCKALGISYHTLQAYLRYRSTRPDGWDRTPGTWVGSRAVHEREDGNPAAT